jgi:hypothetical protein
MAREDHSPRFGPGVWATVRDTGEYVKVESWSGIAAAYRVHSVKSGLQFLTEADLDEVPEHPDARLGKQWIRCRAPKCGAPLTADLPVCERCGAPVCTCGRCECGRTSTASRARKAKAKPQPVKS